jgi:hypothetical protein
VSLDVVSVKVDGAGPQLGDDAGGLPRDLGVCGTGLGMPGSTAPGDAIPTSESSGAAGPGAISLLLPGYRGSSSPLIKLR